MKRPACFHRQTGACRRCGLAVSQPCRGREEPVEATDPSATDRRTPTDWLRTKRRRTPSQASNGRSDQPQAPDQCPASEAINLNRRTGVQRRKRSTSNHRTGVQREKGLSLQPPDWTEDEGLSQLRRISPRCLRRTNVNSASAAFPRGRPGESESSSGHARATGITHPGFYGRKPWRKPNSEASIAAPRPAEEGLGRPFRKLPPNRSLKLPAKPPHARPGYQRQSPNVTLRRSSAFRSALRVSKNAV